MRFPEGSATSQPRHRASPVITRHVSVLNQSGCRLPGKSWTSDAATRLSSVMKAVDDEHREYHRGRFSIGEPPSGYKGMDDVDQLVS